jgi:hypothetical protein
LFVVIAALQYLPRIHLKMREQHIIKEHISHRIEHDEEEAGVGHHDDSSLRTIEEPPE